MVAGAAQRATATYQFSHCPALRRRLDLEAVQSTRLKLGIERRRANDAARQDSFTCSENDHSVRTHHGVAGGLRQGDQEFEAKDAKRRSEGSSAQTRRDHPALRAHPVSGCDNCGCVSAPGQTAMRGCCRHRENDLEASPTNASSFIRETVFIPLGGAQPHPDCYETVPKRLVYMAPPGSSGASLGVITMSKPSSRHCTNDMNRTLPRTTHRMACDAQPGTVYVSP